MAKNINLKGSSEKNNEYNVGDAISILTRITTLMHGAELEFIFIHNVKSIKVCHIIHSVKMIDMWSQNF